MELIDQWFNTGNLSWRAALDAGIVIPACPLALQSDGKWSERHQRALARYYVDAGAGGLAVGVHTTQFAIRQPEYALYEPVLRIVQEELADRASGNFVRVAGVCGRSAQGRGRSKAGRRARVPDGIAQSYRLEARSRIRSIGPLLQESPKSFPSSASTCSQLLVEEFCPMSFGANSRKLSKWSRSRSLLLIAIERWT